MLRRTTFPSGFSLPGLDTRGAAFLLAAASLAARVRGGPVDSFLTRVGDLLALRAGDLLGCRAGDLLGCRAGDLLGCRAGDLLGCLAGDLLAFRWRNVASLDDARRAVRSLLGFLSAGFFSVRDREGLELSFWILVVRLATFSAFESFLISCTDSAGFSSSTSLRTLSVGGSSSDATLSSTSTSLMTSISSRLLYSLTSGIGTPVSVTICIEGIVGCLGKPPPKTSAALRALSDFTSLSSGESYGRLKC